MSGGSSPVNGDFEAANTEPAMRLTVRKDLFPDDRLPKVATDESSIQEDLGDISCVKLETDFEQSIDEIANQKLHTVNGQIPSPEKSRRRKHKQHSRHKSERKSTHNGCLPSDTKKRKSSRESRHHRTLYTSKTSIPSPSMGGKNLNLVSSSKSQDDDESSEDEVLGSRVKLPVNIVRQSGKPYSHELSQLSSKKTKSRDFSKPRRSQVVVPSSGKPRSMLGICSSRSKKKSKKTDGIATYRSQIVDTTTIKIKIRRTSNHERIPPSSLLDIVPKKSKKKKSSTPVVSESSGEEYDPGCGDTAASMSVGAPKPRHPPRKNRKSNPKHRIVKTEKTDALAGGSVCRNLAIPQSPWGNAMPKEILIKIFESVVSSQGTLPSMIRLSRVCKLWHSVSCSPELWRSVDLAQYTYEKFKIDYRLVWLLENRLRHTQTLNLAHWKVSNLTWVLACLADYSPHITELGLAGWSRLQPEHLYELMQNLPNLRRLDLSLTSESGGSGSCLSAASIARLTESFGDRITHLTMANNKFTSLQQILTSIASHCPNLEVLDISGARATSHPAAVPLEALQKGCPKIRVFRAANAQLVLASATTSQQMEAGGWSQLEELSVAGEAAAERVGVGEYRLGDDALSRLVRGSTRLRLLDLRGLQRLSHSGLVRVPAWDLQHLFLGGCNVSRQSNSGLELICEKWSHSLLELDLSWATAARVLDAAVEALSDNRQSKLKVLNLCGSSVSLEPVKKVLMRCLNIESINLSSCRALPRGMKRLYTGKELQDLKDSLDPAKVKIKEVKQPDEMEVEKNEADSKSDILPDNSGQSDNKSLQNALSSSTDQDTANKSCDSANELSETNTNNSLNSESIESKTTDFRNTENSSKNLMSPSVQSKPDSSSTPTSEASKVELGSPHFSPVSKQGSQLSNSPEVHDITKSNSSWNLGQFKTTPTHKSEASPLTRMDSHTKIKQTRLIEQCSPTTSQDNKISPENMKNLKQDLKNPNTWNYGSYSPMPRQDTQFAQHSPYSAQLSPAQPSPYSAQPSPYSAQPSPYSSQPSPYSAQPSPDTSQIVKSDLQKPGGQWNLGSYSPMTKHTSPFSPHTATHTSPDLGLNIKGESLRNNPNKTPGQYSPMSRQDRIHKSPYSPRPSVDNVYSNKKSPGLGNYSPLMRPDCTLPSPDGGQPPRVMVSRPQDIYSQTLTKVPEMLPEITPTWGTERFGASGNNTSTIDPSLVWGGQTFPDPMTSRNIIDNIPGVLNTPPAQNWNALPSFESSVRRNNDDLPDPWALDQFRVEPPHQVHNNFIDQSFNFDALAGHLAHNTHIPQSYLDESFSQTSRVD